MVVSVNNESRRVEPDTTLGDLLLNCGYDVDKSMFAVAINSTFVPREQYASRLIKSDDLIDVIQPISGG